MPNWSVYSVCQYQGSKRDVVYTGVTSRNVDSRYQEHLAEAKKLTLFPRRTLMLALMMQSNDDLCVEIESELLNKQDAFKLEKELIKKYKPLGNTYHNCDKVDRA